MQTFLCTHTESHFAEFSPDSFYQLCYTNHVV